MRRFRFMSMSGRRPATTVFVLAGVVGWGVVAANAVFMQPGPHPAPLLGAPSERTALARPQPQPQAAPAPVADAGLLREIQHALADHRFYDGPVDGYDGPRTQAAIRAYQRAAGLDETGRAEPFLLAHIRLSSLVAEPAGGQSPTRPEGAPTDGDPGGMDALISRTARQDAGNSAPDTAAPQPDIDPLVAAVQRVLSDFGYAPGAIDGQLGPATRAAIERFERDRGLEPTGRIGERLIEELEAVSGAELG